MGTSALSPMTQAFVRPTISRTFASAPFRSSPQATENPLIFTNLLYRLGAAQSHHVQERSFHDCRELRRRVSSQDVWWSVKPYRGGRTVQCRFASQSSQSREALKKTALHDLHVENGGKMVAFGGYSMPVQYTDLGVGESHQWTREKASLFDVGHM